MFGIDDALLAAGGSALIGGLLGGKKKNQTVTQNSEPWGPQQPFLTQGFNQAATNLQGGGPQPFPDQTYAPFSAETETALGAMWDRARRGSPVMNQAQRLGLDTLQGDYLNKNPWIDRMYRRAADQATPYINSVFGGAGRTGSLVHEDALNRQLTDLATQIYGQNYENERGRQMQMMTLAPGLAAENYNDIGRMLQVGGAIEGQAQNGINDRIQRWNAIQNLPRQNLADYIAAISGNYGGQSTQNSTMSGSPIGGALGGGLLGWQIANSMFGNQGGNNGQTDPAALAAMGAWGMF